jgi:hypothetical protein
MSFRFSFLSHSLCLTSRFQKVLRRPKNSFRLKLSTSIKKADFDVISTLLKKSSKIIYLEKLNIQTHYTQ